MALNMDETEKKEMKKFLEQKAEMLKAISSPVRLCILTYLSMQDESNVTDLQCCIDVSQSTISQHLSKLKAADIISGRREGNEIYYQIKDQQAKDIINIILNQNNKT